MEVLLVILVCSCLFLLMRRVGIGRPLGIAAGIAMIGVPLLVIGSLISLFVFRGLALVFGVLLAIVFIYRRFAHVRQAP